MEMGNTGKTPGAGNRYLEELRKRVGLPESMPEEEVFAFTACVSPAGRVPMTPQDWEERRKRLAILHRLPENAKWIDVIRTKVEFGRKKTAEELGLDENSTWSQISKVAAGRERQAAKNLNSERDPNGNKIPQDVLERQKKEGDEARSITIQVASHIGLSGHRMSWSDILSQMRDLGIKIN